MLLELLTLPRHIRAARCEAGIVARDDWNTAYLTEALFDEDQYRIPDYERERMMLALEALAAGQKERREYASMERRKKQGRPITRHAPRRQIYHGRTDWAARDREVMQGLGLRAGDYVQCLVTDHKTRRKTAKIYHDDDDRHRAYCYNCGEGCTMADYGEGVFA